MVPSEPPPPFEPDLDLITTIDKGQVPRPPRRRGWRSRGHADKQPPRVELFRFVLTIEGADLLDAAAQEALFQVGCSDATFSSVGGVQTGEFDRIAAGFADAVGSAIHAVETAVPGARVVELRREPAAAVAH